MKRYFITGLLIWIPLAITLWVLLFPEKPGEITAFGFVQHNFFILFNAAIGLIFLRRATTDLFGAPATAK